MRLFVVALLALIATPLQGGIITYNFSGNFNGNISNSFGPIHTGTPFTGSFSIDTSVPGITDVPPNQAFTGYLNAASIEFAIPAVGLTISSSIPFAGSAGISHSSIPVGLTHDDGLSFDFPLDTFSGAGWPYVPALPMQTGATFSFIFPGGTLTDLAHLPVLAGMVTIGAIGFGAGEYTFPGGSLSAGGPLHEQTGLGISLAFVPEPSSLVLAALGLICALAMEFRQLVRNIAIIALVFASVFASTAKAATIAQITLETTDLVGNPITSIAPGGSFRLEAFVQDTRNPPATHGGVFAAYFDAVYNPSLVSIAANAPITFGPTFVPPLSPSHDFSTPGVINGTGAASQNFSAPGNAPQLLLTIPATATNPGIETFTPSFDTTPGHEILLYSTDTSVPADQVSFVGTTLTIVPEPSSVVLWIIGAIGLAAIRWRRRLRFDRREATAL